jgi:hypothetical protein
MERLVALICRLFNREQHLEGEAEQLKERHKNGGGRSNLVKEGEEERGAPGQVGAWDSLM